MERVHAVTDSAAVSLDMRHEDPGLQPQTTNSNTTSREDSLYTVVRLWETVDREEFVCVPTTSAEQLTYIECTAEQQ